MAANQLTVKAWKGVTADIPTASMAESGKLFFYVDTSASTHVVKVCRKVSGTPTWQDLAIASEVVPTSTLTTRGDLLIRGASAPERLALGLAGFRPASDGTDVIWSAVTKANTSGSRPAASSLYAGMFYYSTDTHALYLGVQTGGVTYAWSGMSQSIQFTVTNVAAGDNATAASSTPVQAQWAGAAAVAVGWVAPRPGSVRSLSCALSAAAAGSDCIVGIHKNGTLMDAAAIVTMTSAGSQTKGYANFALGGFDFDANDVLDVRVRTGSGWSATTADLGVSLEVEC